MKLNAKFAKEAILNKNGLNHLQIELVPSPKEPKEKQRKPVLMIFVIDRSGSMGGIAKSAFVSPNSSWKDNSHTWDLGSATLPSDYRIYDNWRFPPYPYTFASYSQEKSTKMDYAINAVTKFLNLLTEKDLFGVVSFNEIACVDQPLTSPSPHNLSSIIANIRQIQPKGCTNISDGLLMAKKMITPDLAQKYNCKIILLSDGQANVGVTDLKGLSSIALECLQSGITVSGLGIGLDYDSGIMGGIAQHGGGLFYHIEDLSMLEEIFKEELSLSNAVTAKNVKLYISIPDLIEIGNNLNDYPQKVVGSQIEILIGDLYGPRKVVLEIRNDFVENDVSFDIAVSYKSSDGLEYAVKETLPLKVVKTKEELAKYPEDKLVIDNVLSLIKYRTLLQTAERYQHGDMDSVQAAFCGSSQELLGISMTYSTHNTCFDSVVSELNQTNAMYKQGTVSVSSAKKIYADSYRQKRN